MAVKFFRMSEKGSIKRPTLVAIGCTFASWIVAMFFLREHPFLCVFIAWPLEYFFFAILLSSPFRITLGKIMHWTRYHIIMAVPTPADKAWLEANQGVFKKTGLKMYIGETAAREKEKEEEISPSLKSGRKYQEKIKVIYPDDR